MRIKCVLRHFATRLLPHETSLGGPRQADSPGSFFIVGAWGCNSAQPGDFGLTSTTVVLASDRVNPGLKAPKSTLAFRGMNPLLLRNDYLQLCTSRLRKKAEFVVKSTESIPQGLKPIHLLALIGTAEVVPGYKALSMSFAHL